MVIPELRNGSSHTYVMFTYIYIIRIYHANLIEHANPANHEHYKKINTNPLASESITILISTTNIITSQPTGLQCNLLPFGVVSFCTGSLTQTQVMSLSTRWCQPASRSLGG